MKIIPFTDSSKSVSPPVFQVLTIFVSCLICVFLVTNNAEALSNSNRLEQVGFSSMPGNRVQIKLDFAGPAITPSSFSTANPARIVLDFPGTQLALRKKSQPIGIGVVQSTNVVSTSNRARVVVNLVRLVPFKIAVQGNRVLISVENMATKFSKTEALSQPSQTPISTTLPVQPRPTTPIQPTPVAPVRPTIPIQPVPTVPVRPTIPTPPIPAVPMPKRKPIIPVQPPTRAVPVSVAIPQVAHILDIDFRRTQDGTARIAITLSDPSIIVDMRRKAPDIILEFPNVRLSSKLDRRLDVLDFGTPVSFIDTFSIGANVRMNITVRGDYEHHAYQTGSVYVVEVKEKIEEKTENVKIEERKYEGRLVSFDFQNIEVRSVLSLLFGLPGVNLNMVAGDEVGGSITLRLKNVPWDQALDIILEARGLGRRKIGNVVMIDLKKNINERKQKELEALKKIKELEPLYTEFITINYAKASDFVSLLRTKGDHSFLSNRGSVSMDERTNTLIIQDTAVKIVEIRKLIASLDIPIRQVLIESRIVIATDNFSKDLGVKFGYSANEDLGHGNGIVFGGKVAGDTQFSGGTAFPGGSAENYIVSLPASVSSPAAVGLAIGKIGSYLLQLELSAMQSERKGEILSSPRVVTGNQQEAVITQGTEIAYVPPSTGVGTVSKVQFKNAVLELKVTPQITPDDRISLSLSVKKDSVGDTLNGVVSIDKREVKTNVLVDNGETVVLGGVYERSTRYTVDRVPFFADLPLIGELFKRRSNVDNKSELLIFVTPKIIKEAT